MLHTRLFPGRFSRQRRFVTAFPAAVLAFFFLAAISVQAAPELLDSGNAGPLSFQVIFDESTDMQTTLFVSGNGAIPDYVPNTNGSTAPWYHSMEDVAANLYRILNLSLGNGITRIGNYAFYNSSPAKIMSLCEDLVIPDTVTSIGIGAFRGNQFSYNFGEGRITIPDSVTSIGDGAIDPTVIIVCSENSAAWKYAKANGNRTELPGQYKPEPEATTVAIEYVLNGGNNNKANPSSADTGTEISLKAPSRKGYAFAGWYSDASFSNRVTSLSTDSSCTFYAKWTKIKTGRAAAPKLTSPAKSRLKLKLKKVSKANGYQIQYSLKINFPKSATKSKKTSKLSLTLKLKSKKTWYVRVRAYRKDSAGKLVYGSWSKTAKRKVK